MLRHRPTLTQLQPSKLWRQDHITLGISKSDESQVGLVQLSDHVISFISNGVTIGGVDKRHTMEDVLYVMLCEESWL